MGFERQINVEKSIKDIIQELKEWQIIEKELVVDYTLVPIAYCWESKEYLKDHKEKILNKLKSLGIFSTGRYGKWETQGVIDSIKDGFTARGWLCDVKRECCAVIVTYNRKTLLLECLESLRKQTRPLQGIYLIDNASKDGTPELLLERGSITEPPPEELNEPCEKEFTIQNLTDGSTIRFHYVRMHENTGGAGGFYEGVKRGYEKGYDWLWMMTQNPKKTRWKKQPSISTLIASPLRICP